MLPRTHLVCTIFPVHADNHARLLLHVRAGNGSMVGAIMGSTKQEPNTVGKPSGFMLDNIANTFKLQKDEVRHMQHASLLKR